MIDSSCLERHGLDRNGQAGKDLKKLEMIEVGKEKNIMEMVMACEMDYFNGTAELETVGLSCMVNELKVMTKELEVTGWIYKVKVLYVIGLAEVRTYWTFNPVKAQLDMV